MAASAIAMASAFHTVDPRAHALAAHRSMVIHGSLPTLDQYDTQLGRKIPPTPPHLTSRSLYVPSHNDKITHLPVYEFTDEFKAAIKDEPIGSSRFKTCFGLMKKPCGDGTGSSSVMYLLDFEPLEVRRSLSGPEVRNRRKSSVGSLVTKATVQRRMLYGAGVEVGLTIPPLPLPGTTLEDGTVACIISPASMTMTIPVVTSFPVTPTISKFGSSRNPWFTFTVPSLLDEERTLQWQIHPTELGMLRYTLIEIPQVTPVNVKASGNAEEPEVSFSAADPENEHLIRAIYHNVGLGFSLSQPFSEGALLIQNDFDPELEALILASLLGVLWRARNEESKVRKGSKSDSSGKPARKGSVDEGEATGPGKKKLFRKILGKK
ncbi:hypothetical protein N0V93_006069 [Gnomoniopsis smithogilvyi]|uniref:Uncharacterized protein n=1 Tax=Gnomoniopsis smithogilvyi TaxID=1191159 RepID=A0A9W9CV93_9PEZI|nr:hypothetical protein N0V93_006069 [Gnomoniopsis smithogilvyi]